MSLHDFGRDYVAPRPIRLAVAPAEAAEMLGVCRATIYNMLAKGEVRSVKILGARRIPVTELERLVGGDPDGGRAV